MSAPAPAPATARDRLIDTAADLFARHGFGPVGLDRIIAEVNTTKTTFYKYFESKDALIIAVLEQRNREELEELSADMRRRAGADNPRGQILALFDAFDDWFRQTDFRGCMFMHAANEFPAENDPVHRAAIAHGEQLARMVVDLAQKAGAKDPGALAEQISILLSGALIQRHVGKQINAALSAKAAAEGILKMHLDR